MDRREARGGREFCLATLQQWGVTELHEDVAVVVSELLTNAFRHAVPGLGHSRPGWPVRLGLLHSGARILCAVADPSSSAPVLRKPRGLAESGRGLQVVCALSEAWGYTGYATPSETGKVVWATLTSLPC
jgi:anti-sigma regulatory factor (Ser/Thr protein kinase)